MTKDSKRSKPITAGELLEQLRSDPEWVAKDREREVMRAKFRADLREESGPLLRDLESMGISIPSVYDLVNTSDPYPEAIPVLIEHLGKPYHPRIREGIARALTVPEAKPALPKIFEAFRRETDTSVNGPKWALGNAIYTLADESHVPEILSLVLDPSHGQARDLLVYALARSPSPEARNALEQLKSDPEVGLHVGKAVAQRGRIIDG